MEEFLRATLMAALPGIGIDWVHSPQGFGLPRIILTRISGGPDYTMSGPSGLARARVQIDCYQSTVGGAKTLARSVKSALSGLRLGVISGAFLDAERDLPVDTGGGLAVAGASLDFVIHYQE